MKAKYVFRTAAMAVVLTLLTFCALASAQLTGTTSPSPKEVVRAYRKMDANGERLTECGWNKGNAFFLQPSPPPHDLVLGVMAAGEMVGEAKIDGERAEVWTEFDLIGKVYPDGRFSRSPGGSPPINGPLPSRRKYSLVLTHGSAASAAQSGAEWKIEDFEPNPTVTVDVAVHYLERLRDATDKDDVKKNTERSIAELTALQNNRAK